MSTGLKRKHILLIDHQSYWREISCKALQTVGFYVYTLATYDQVSLQRCLQRERLDLIVLGCSRVGNEEQNMIQFVLDRKQHLLVLSTTLSFRLIRSLFLLGVDDIIDKPYNSEHLIQLVDEALANTVPRNSYQAVERASNS